MTGERMRLEGFTEISGVCCDEAHRGCGFPAELMRAAASTMLARGETPFLHVFANNHLAIALYRRLGFKVRRSLRAAILRRSSRDSTQSRGKVHPVPSTWWLNHSSSSR